MPYGTASALSVLYDQVVEEEGQGKQGPRLLQGGGAMGLTATVGSRLSALSGLRSLSSSIRSEQHSLH